MKRNEKIWGVDDLVIHANDAKEKKLAREIAKSTGKEFCEISEHEFLGLKGFNGFVKFPLVIVDECGMSSKSLSMMKYVQSCDSVVINELGIAPSSGPMPSFIFITNLKISCLSDFDSRKFLVAQVGGHIISGTSGIPGIDGFSSSASNIAKALSA